MKTYFMEIDKCISMHDYTFKKKTSNVSLSLSLMSEYIKQEIIWKKLHLLSVLKMGNDHRINTRVSHQAFP